MTTPSPEQLPSPIVLIVDDDPDTRDMYSTFFQSCGMWPATASDPGEGMEAVDELKPDAIVTDIGFGSSPLGVSVVHDLRTHEQARHTPLVVLSGRGAEQIPAQTRQEVDLVLLKPVLPDVLATRVGELIARAKLARERSGALCEKSEQLATRADALISHNKRLSGERATLADDTATPVNRRCPKCAKPLEWLERGTTGGSEYDYYRWCFNGCGLYCYNRRVEKWVKLA